MYCGNYYKGNKQISMTDWGVEFVGNSFKMCREGLLEEVTFKLRIQLYKE